MRSRHSGLTPMPSTTLVRARPEPAADMDAIEGYLGADGLVRRGNGLVALIDGDACGFIRQLPQGAAPVAVGISGPVGLSAMEPAARQAARALETALALGAKGIFDLGALGLDAAVVSDVDVGEAMVRRYIEPFDDHPGGSVLLQTVERYLVNDLSIETTAQDFGRSREHCSPAIGQSRRVDRTPPARDGDPRRVLVGPAETSFRMNAVPPAVSSLPPSRATASSAAPDRAKRESTQPLKRHAIAAEGEGLVLPRLHPWCQGRSSSAGVTAVRGAPPLLEEVVRPPRTATGREPPLPFPLPIYSAPEALMKPRVVPHNRRPKRRNQRNGRS
jgi:hypothetical protein